MPERIDRGITNSNWPLWLLAIIIVAGAGGGAWWYFGVPAAQQKIPAPLSRSTPLEEPLAVTLYYPADGMLIAAPAAVPRQASAQMQAHEVLNALFADPRVKAGALKGFKLRAFFLDADGTGYVDFSPAAPNAAAASVRDELLGIYAVVNALTRNFDEIRQVRFLIDGSEAQSLAGHVDLSWTFEKRMDLVKQ